MNDYMKFASSPRGHAWRTPQGKVKLETPEGPEVLFLLLDVSGSMSNIDWPPSRLGAAREAATALLNVKAEHHPQDHVGIISFSDFAEVVHRPAEVGEHAGSLREALEQLVPDSNTNLPAALEMVEALVMGRAPAVPHVPKGFQWLARFCLAESHVPAPQVRSCTGLARRALILTDGRNTAEDPKPPADRLKALGVVIDAIGIGGSPSDVDEPLLKSLASMGPDGPRYTFIGQKTQLIKKFQQLGRHLRAL